MKIEHIDINKTLEDARGLLANEKNISPAFKAVMEILFLVITLMMNRISRFVTEYRAQILEDQNGNSFVAPFPSHVTRPVQYGQDLKAHAVYLSQFQLLTYNRIDDYFGEEINVPISMGSIYNFNKEAFVLLKKFDDIAKQKLS